MRHVCAMYTEGRGGCTKAGTSACGECRKAPYGCIGFEVGYWKPEYGWIGKYVDPDNALSRECGSILCVMAGRFGVWRVRPTLERLMAGRDLRNDPTAMLSVLKEVKEAVQGTYVDGYHGEPPAIYCEMTCFCTCASDDEWCGDVGDDGMPVQATGPVLHVRGIGDYMQEMLIENDPSKTGMPCIVQPEIGSSRIATAFRGADGKPYYLTAEYCRKPDAPSGRGSKKAAAAIEKEYPYRKNGATDYVYPVTDDVGAEPVAGLSHKRLEWTRYGLLRFVNENFGTSFVRVEVHKDGTGYSPTRPGVPDDRLLTTEGVVLSEEYAG